MCLHLTLLVSMPFLFQFLTSYLTVGQVLILPDTSCHETSCMMQLHSFESLETLFMIAGFLDFVHHVVLQTIRFRNHIYFCPGGKCCGRL